MTKPYSLDLRGRVVRFVEAGHSRRVAAAHFGVSVSFVVILMRNYRKTESLAPKASGGRRHSKLDPHRAFLLGCVAEKDDVTMPELAAQLVRAAGVQVAPASISRWLIRNGYRFKKTLLASEQDRSDISKARQEWRTKCQPRMRLEPDRLVFIDETGTTTKMTRLRGCCLKGRRLRSKAPFGHWKTQTFIAGLRCHGLTAPFVVDTPMNRRIFETYVETQLAPTLAKGDVVILDNLAAHKSPAAEAAIRARGAWLLFLPPYSPDLNPIEMAFAKLKAHLRAKAIRTIDALWQAIGDICNLFSPTECRNFFIAAGYGLK
ncbi:IS630 family transposase [Mesorhizobium sp. B3-1-3]|uniref:IS630 family transposase n=1 Tax=unclassified Mesorhizobium TaxID=325217 RepID=UPI00112DC6C9|nr:MULTISPECIES: IS630 family transposase [unclassified Mesorhizobium]TPI56039.1 IS630 family transposase [Mesorhizobium sp. B3-1-8]TPI63333.1 IS630 family transposase [Mesorhizobium sp. B3-1-3]